MSDLSSEPLLKDTFEKDTLEKISACTKPDDLESLRVSILGKKGTLSAQMKEIGKLSLEERKQKGAALNRLKTHLHEAFLAQKKHLHKQAIRQRLAQEHLDLSLPVRLGPLHEGRIHPVSQTLNELISIFSEMGFSVAEGSDIETDYHNFTALNFPPEHPARDMHDTFFFEEDTGADSRLLLRTHTSPVQIHRLQAQEPPLRVIIPGRTYRCDSDQTHTPMFHQLEGLVVDKESHIGHLKWILEEFCRRFFELETVKMRYRQSFFPFTEPSLEVDIGCQFKKNEIRIGKGSDWLEILGCGMIHPNVLRNCGLDPDIYQGFAWGLGVDRVAMLKYGMPDLRAFFENDIRWIKHYGFRAFSI